LLAGLEAAVLAITLADSETALQAAPSGYLALLDYGDVADRVKQLEATPPLAEYGFLRGMCGGALKELYARAHDTLVLDRGVPFPLPERPTHMAIQGATPNPATLQAGHLLDETGFRLYAGSASSDPITCELDFSSRDLLDAATWIGDAESGSFPLIATVHPYAEAGDLRVTEINGEWWFGVRPTNWCPDAIISQLASVHDAGCAIIPELSLPTSEALNQAIAGSADDLPPLIVAGSAHITTQDPDDPRVTIRANECLVYLHGAPLLRHRKIHAFRTRYLGPEHQFAQPLPEGLTPEPKRITIASGSLTRLAVIICADLNDTHIPGLLTDVGVNLLLVPALTPHAGAFPGGIGGVASSCQGVSVIANGTPAVAPQNPAAQPPFLVMAAVPIASATQQREYPAPATGRRAVGLFDANSPLENAMTWR
jgi:hypothetical protein